MRQVLVTFGMIFAIVELCLVLSPPSYAQATAVVNPWNEVVPRGEFWPERWDFQLVSHRDHMLVVGGQNNSGYLNDIWASRNGQQWRQLPMPAWSARAYFQLVDFNGALFLIGGETAEGMSNEIWVSRDQGQNWQQVVTGPEVFGPRRLHQVLVFNDQMVLLGGEDDEQQQYSDIWVSDNGAHWREVNVDGTQWGQRKYFRAIAHRDQALVLGGLDPAERNQVFVSEDLLNWRAVSPEGQFWGERMFFSSTVIDDEVIWFIGGGSTPLGSEASDILIADRKEHWRLVQPEDHFDRRGHHEAVVHKDRLYLMGGKREDAVEKVAHRDIWVRDLHESADAEE
jgi:hypothetical protein